MKYVLLVSMLIGLALTSACPELKNSVAESNNNSALSKNQNAVAQQNNVNLATPTAIAIPKLKFTPKEPMVWVSQILTDDSTGEITITAGLSNGEIDASPEYDRIGMTTDVDIFNCAGYLMSGRAQKKGIYGWTFEPMPETAAVDAFEKVKQCDTFSEDERKRENLSPSSGVFAVAPTDRARRSIKAGKLDATGIFAELPREIQKLLNDKRFDTDFVRRPLEGEISVKNSDEMADIDGDGKVDLIGFETICSEDDDSEGDGCGFIFMKLNGKWKEVGFTQKA